MGKSFKHKSGAQLNSFVNQKSFEMIHMYDENKDKKLTKEEFSQQFLEKFKGEWNTKMYDTAAANIWDFIT